MACLSGSFVYVTLNSEDRLNISFLKSFLEIVQTGKRSVIGTGTGREALLYQILCQFVVGTENVSYRATLGMNVQWDVTLRTGGLQGPESRWFSRKSRGDFASLRHLWFGSDGRAQRTGLRRKGFPAAFHLSIFKKKVYTLEGFYVILNFYCSSETIRWMIQTNVSPVPFRKSLSYGLRDLLVWKKEVQASSSQTNNYLWVQ